MGVEAHSRKEKSACFETLKMSSKVLLALVTFTFLATSCLGYPGGSQDGLPGGIATRQKCPPKPPTIKEFNATECLGIWYEQRRFPAFFQLNTRCVRATYGPCPDPDQPGSWRLTTTTTLLSTLARISCLERSSLSLLGSWQESNTLTLICLSMRPKCLWTMASTSHPWRTPSRMRTVCMRETFDCLESLFIRS